MQPPVETSSSRVLTFPSLAVIALGGAALSIVLVPNHTPLHERFEKNKLCALIQPVLAEGRFENGITPAAALLDMPSAKLDELAGLSQLPPREQLGRIFTRSGRVRYDAIAHAFTLAAVRDPHAIALDEAFETIRPKCSDIPEQQRLEVLEVLATNALATRQPDLATEILRESCRAAVSTWQSVKDMISSARLAGKPAIAIEELRLWLPKHAAGLDAIQQLEARHLHYSLAIDCDLPGEAFDLCLEDFKKSDDIADISADLMEQAYEAATLGERTKELLPWIESRLATFPEAALTWQELMNAAPDKTCKLWLQRAADIADAHALADKAFAHHERILAMGDDSGLDRFLPLAAQVRRTEEAWAIIQAVSRQPGKASIRLQCARVLAANGRAEQATGLFEAWVAAHPTDRDAAFELACLKEKTADLTTAVAQFEAFVRAFPRDVAGVKKLAALRIRHGQPESALREYDQLQDSDHDVASLEDYALLAESLGRTESLLRALRLSANDPARATPALFLRMADLARQQSPEENSAETILSDGIDRLPKSPSLRVKLASLLLEREQYHGALEQALNPVAKDRLEAQSIAVAAAIHIDRSREVVALVGPDFEKRNDLPLATRLHLAVACCLAGDTARGEALFATVQPERSTFARIAEARMLAGHAEKAEELARQSIAQSTSPQPADWILLGDARTRLGRADEARDAYSKALSVVSRKISTSQPADPVAAEATNSPTFLSR